jgi:hypothetical protein
MARVPVVLPREGLLQPLRVPTLNLDAGPGVFGADVARGLGNIGAVSSDIALDLKRRKDAAEASEIIGTTAAAALDLFKNPESGLLTRKMKGASGVTNEATERLGALWADAEAQATSAATRLIVKEHARRQIAQDTEAAANHEISERENYADWSAGKLIQSSVERSALTPMDAQVAGQAAADVAAAVKMRLQGRASPEEIAQAQSEAVSALHATRVSSLLAQGANSDAIALYGEIESQLTSEHRTKVAPSIRAARDLLAEQEFTDSMLSKHPDNRKAALDEAHATLSGKAEDDAVTAINNRYNEIDSARQDAQRVVVSAGWKAFARRTKVADIPRDIFAALPGETIQAMKNQEEADANRTPGPRHTDPAVFGEWMNRPSEEKVLPEFAPQNYAGSITPSDIRFMQILVADILSTERGVTRAGREFASPRLDTQSVAGIISTAVLENAPYLDAPSNKKLADERQGMFVSYVRANLDAKIAETGKNPTREDVRKIIDEALIKVTRHVDDPGAWNLFEFNEVKARRFEVRPGERFTPTETGGVQIPQEDLGIPAEDLALIDAALRLRGQVPTDALRREMYSRRNPAEGVSP